MFTRKRRTALGVTMAVLAVAYGIAAASTPSGLGTPATSTQIRAWNDEIAPDGAGLPPGSGSVAQGGRVYATQCAACHGANGQSGPMDKLVGGKESLGTAKPVKTVGSYWPYATTVFDYVRRAMPFNRPGTLSNDEAYAVTAYVLHLNDIVPADATMDAKTLPRVRMPNRDGFLQKDPRPDAP
ncbi:MAG: cytochrome c [Candidatus Eremiobacteraeota bacterium]|nr:cytochrome c [Candidatus Eremiobacteraeota bacterium]